MSERRGRTDWSAMIASVMAAMDRRLGLALTMIAVAALGAYVAYETGANELRGAQYEREVAQDHLLALTEHQRLLDLAEANAEFRRRILASETRGKAYLATAGEPGQLPLNADVLSMQAQEEFAASRALRPFVRATRTAFGSEIGGDERNLERRIARYLARQGIEVDESGGKNSNIWSTLNKKIHDAHEKVRALALAVLLFVVSLVMFTFADLSQRVYRARRWYIAGFAVALGAIVVVLHTDWEMWTRLAVPLAVPLSVFAVLVLRIVRKRAMPIGDSLHVEPSGLEPRAFPAEAMHARHVPGQPARRIIRMIALTVLFSTVAGFLYSLATTESGEAAHKALEKEIEMHSRTTQRQSGVLATLHDLAQVEEERARNIAATQRAAYLSWRGETGAADLAKAEVRALYGAAAYYQDPRNSESKARQATLKLRDDRVLGVDGDPRFPQGFVRRMALERPAENHRESLALWDTFNRRSLAASENAAAFLATLTMFAVALCLFGQAFNTSRGLAAQALLLSAKCLVVLGVAYALFTLATALEPRLVTMFRPSDIAASAADCKLDDKQALPHLSLAETQAARHYANAHAWLSDARSAEHYQRAVTALSCVVALRPDSALAKLDFANAVERAGLAQTTETFLRAPAKDSLPQMKERMEKALGELRSLAAGDGDGRAPPRLLGNLGRYTLLLAIDSKDPEGIAKSVAYLQRAEERSKRGAAGVDRARILLNLSLALQAAGNDTEADRYFKDALAIGGARNKRLAARAITDLEILQTHCAQIATKDQCAKLPDRVVRAKEALVRAAWSEAAAGGNAEAVSSGGEPAIEGLKLAVGADVVRWSGNLRNVTARDHVVVVWYEFDDEWDAWRALPDVSGKVSSRELTQHPGNWVTRSYLKASGFERCLGGGAARRYRAEFYLNGRHAGAVPEIEIPAGEFTALRLNDLDMALCHPAGWSRVEIPEQMRSDGLLVRGLQTAHEQPKPAAFMFTIYSPVSRETRAEDSRPLQRARASLIQQGILDESNESMVRYDRTAANCEAVIAGADAAYVSWTTAEGVRHVGIALPIAAPPKQICAVLDSLTNRYPPETEPQEE